MFNSRVKLFYGNSKDKIALQTSDFNLGFCLYILLKNDILHIIPCFPLVVCLNYKKSVYYNSMFSFDIKIAPCKILMLCQIVLFR